MSHATNPPARIQPAPLTGVTAECLAAVRNALSFDFDPEDCADMTAEARDRYRAYVKDPMGWVRDRFGDDEVDAALAWIDAEALAALERDERRCGEEG